MTQKENRPDSDKSRTATKNDNNQKDYSTRGVGKQNVFPWMKIYYDSLTDPDLIALRHELFGFYVRLYLLAFGADADGKIIKREGGKALTFSEIGLILHTEEKKVTEYCDDLKAANFLKKEKNNTWVIVRYESEQINQEEQREQWRKYKASRKGKGNDEHSSRNPHGSLEDSSTRRNQEEIKSRGNQEEIKSNQNQQSDDDKSDDEELIDPESNSNSKPSIKGQIKTKDPYKGMLPPAAAAKFIHDDIESIDKRFYEYTNKPMELSTKQTITEAINSGVRTQDILDTLIKTADHKPKDFERYFAKCINSLVPGVS